MFFSKRDNTPPKRWHWIAIGAIILVFCVLKLADWLYFPNGTVYLENKTLKVLVADTPHRQYKGLGGRESLGNWDGMWFSFYSRDIHGIVMRDMSFPIDVVWIDNGVIVDLAENLPPEKGKKEEELTPYYTGRLSTNVLELPAGSISELRLKIGDRVGFVR